MNRTNRPRSWYNENTPLTRWLNGQESLESYVDGSRFFFDQEFGGWIALEKIIEVHKSYELDAQSLEESWNKTQGYVAGALALVHTCKDENPQDLEIEHEDRGDILHQLGEPPKSCYPLYMFSVESNQVEELVYVGLTNSEKSRFSAGHRACTKLLDPQYNNHIKRLYLCRVVLLSKNKDYLPLEWVNPYPLAKQLLDDFESQLIFKFQPVFNDKKKTTNCVKNLISMTIVNYTDETDFLHEVQI